MQKGSRVLKCHDCNKTVGYKELTGQIHLKPGCIWDIKCFRQMFFCEECKEKNKHDCMGSNCTY